MRAKEKLSAFFAELVKRHKYWTEKENNSHSIESEIRLSECQHLLVLFQSMVVDPVSDVLEKEIDAQIAKLPTAPCHEEMADFARHFAEWQKEKDIYAIVNAKSEGYNGGKVLEKQLMLNEAIDAYLERDNGGQLILGRTNSPAGDEFMLLDSLSFQDVKCGERHKVKLLILKED